MKYLLDTNTCIRYITGRSAQVIAKLEALNEGEALLCSMVVAELLYGGFRSQTPEKTLSRQREFIALFTSLSFDDAVAEHYARVRADLSKQGTPIGGNDLLIAATALAHDLILVTHNTREFRRVQGLKLEDWETESDTAP